MQLTKDDIIDNEETSAEAIDLITFQQVVKFYEKYRINPGDLQYKLCNDRPDLWKCWIKESKKLRDVNMYDMELKFDNWLFDHCFGDEE